MSKNIPYKKDIVISRAEILKFFSPKTTELKCHKKIRNRNKKHVYALEGASNYNLSLQKHDFRSYKNTHTLTTFEELNFNKNTV